MDTTLIFWFCMALIFVGQVLAVVGTFRISYKNLTLWTAYFSTVQYLIGQRLCDSIAVNYIHKYKLLSNNQMVFIILSLQFIITSIYSEIILRQNPTISDFIGMGLLTYGYYVSYYKQISSSIFV